MIHGRTGYTHHDCRCEVCTKATRDYMRNVALPRRTPLRANRERTAAWLRRSRKPLPGLSSRRQEKPERDAVREVVLARDGGRCRLGVRALKENSKPTCQGPPTAHHILKASQGGAYTADNLVCLCAMHNGDVECFPALYWAHGLVQRAGETAEETWHRLWANGLSRFPWPGSRP